MTPLTAGAGLAICSDHPLGVRLWTHGACSHLQIDRILLGLVFWHRGLPSKACTPSQNETPSRGSGSGAIGKTYQQCEASLLLMVLGDVTLWTRAAILLSLWVLGLLHLRRVPRGPLWKSRGKLSPELSWLLSYLFLPMLVAPSLFMSIAKASIPSGLASPSRPLRGGSERGSDTEKRGRDK